MTSEIGSIWRKWDLHIHTPNTKMENNFRIEGNSDDTKIWKLYCEELNEYDTSVLGITDYFSVDNYYYLLKNRERFGLDDEIILFPNVELRVSDLRPGNPSNKVNLHIIFDNKLSVSDIKRFFSKLEVENENGQTLNFLDDFEELFDGRNIKYLPTSHDVITALEKGIGTNYKEKVLIMVPNGDDGISPNPSHGFGRNKDFICKHVDLINTANPTDIRFYLERAKDDLGRQYPCVSGCDAHSFEGITGYPKEKVTWIKADTTFEGLKSITLEPESRVHIGEISPDLKANRKILSSLTIKHGDFGEQTVHFNPYLNTIIGGRSSGKSLFLSILAHKATGETELKKDNDSYNELILNYAQDTEIKLYDGSTIDKNMILTFIYQDGLQEIAFDDDKRNQFIKDIIGKNDQIDKHSNTIKDIKSTVQAKNNELEKIGSQYEALVKENEKIQKASDIEANIHQFNKQLENYKSDLTDKEVKEAKTIVEYCKKAEGIIQKFNNQILEQKEILKNEPLVLNPNIQTVYSSGLKSNLNRIIKSANNDIANYIRRSISRKKSKIDVLSKEITNKQSSESYRKYLHDQKNNPIKKQIIEKIDEETKRLTKKKELNKKLNILKDNFLNITDELLVSLNIQPFINNKKIFNEDNVEIDFEISLDFIKMKETFQTFFNINYTAFKDIAYGKIRDINSWNEQEKQIVKIDNEFIEDYSQTLKNILKSDKSTLTPFLKKNATLFDFIHQLSSFPFLKIDFNIKYDGYEFDNMSEGKKSFILLILILSQTDEQDPLLIDQPEDNLDNRAIYNDLIKYLRVEKKKRQIFVVTHNANVAVASDSENIIIANEHDAENENPNGTKFYYRNGSLENPEIEKEVCEILEGGTEAFMKRRVRYNIEELA